MTASSAPTYSKYQTALFDFVTDGTGNAVVSAVAGSGKTFTITKALDLIPANESVLFLAFNKHIVEELKGKLAKLNKSNVEVMTLHSYGSKVLWMNTKSHLDADKAWRVCDALYPSWNVNEEIANGYVGRVKRLVELAKLSLANSVEDLYDIAEKHGIEIYNGEVENALQVKQITDSNTRSHDFNDMIYLPIRHNMRCKQYDWVFIDECQDLSVCQQELMKRSIKPNGRFIAVGDPHQCIYGFAGADVDSFRKLAAVPNTVTLPLSLTYRCSKAVVAKAQTLVPHIEALEDAVEGVVRYDGKIAEFKSGDMILSRVNRPLITLCIQLLAQHTKAYVKGKDIGINLINMLKKTKRSDYESAMKHLYKDRGLMINKLVRKGISQEDAENSPAINHYNEKMDALDALSSGLSKVSEVIARIEKIFSDESDGICLSTVHKAKGLEANKVFIVEPAMMPAPFAKKAWELVQEDNIAYVAYTRARQELVFVPESEFTTYEKKKK